MNNKQRDAIASPHAIIDSYAYRVTIIDAEGAMLDVALFRDVAEMTNEIENYHDATGVVILVEVL